MGRKRIIKRSNNLIDITINDFINSLKKYIQKNDLDSINNTIASNNNLWQYPRCIVKFFNLIVDNCYEKNLSISLLLFDHYNTQVTFEHHNKIYQFPKRAHQPVKKDVDNFFEQLQCIDNWELNDFMRKNIKFLKCNHGLNKLYKFILINHEQKDNEKTFLLLTHYCIIKPNILFNKTNMGSCYGKKNAMNAQKETINIFIENIKLKIENEDITELNNYINHNETLLSIPSCQAKFYYIVKQSLVYQPQEVTVLLYKYYNRFSSSNSIDNLLRAANQENIKLYKKILDRYDNVSRSITKAYLTVNDQAIIIAWQELHNSFVKRMFDKNSWCFNEFQIDGSSYHFLKTIINSISVIGSLKRTCKIIPENKFIFSALCEDIFYKILSPLLNFISYEEKSNIKTAQFVWESALDPSVNSKLSFVRLLTEKFTKSTEPQAVMTVS